MSPDKKYLHWKRIFDVFFAIVGIIIFILPLLLIGIIIKITSKESIIHWSTRAGQKNTVFRMAKLRTMKNNPTTQDLKPSKNYFYYLGKLLRGFGIDELPQLYNILKGEMSFVGPRPVLLSDKELIFKREQLGINIAKPGLTGLAQINGRQKLTVHEKVKYDEIYTKNINLILDVKILLLTNCYLIRENIFDKKQNREPGQKLL
jgi:O-antigen biosynthesis protein WbqP